MDTNAAAKNESIIDKLTRRIAELRSPIVVGLDTTLEMIPVNLKASMYREFGVTPRAVSEILINYNRLIIDGICDLVPAVKPQIAMYEKYGLDGIVAYMKTIEYAHKRGMIVIGDIKRGDISSTAEAYAAHLDGVDIDGEYFDPWQEDMITVNPYFGSDGIRPFTAACERTGKGIFILTKTSNPGSSELQDLALESGAPVYLQVARLVVEWGRDLIGDCGFGNVGIVVGATHPGVGRRLREEFPALFFLVPGYGAQGAKAEDLRGFFDMDGRGCIVNSSRGIITAWQKENSFGLGNVGDAARAAVIKMISELDFLK